MAHGSTLDGAKNPYELDVTTELPPGTDSVAQLGEKPRHAVAPSATKTKTVELPPLSERKGKWMQKYLDKLDPNTDYDEIIRFTLLYRLDPFQAALGYNSMFTQLVQTPAGADAIYHGRVMLKAHQRYYETLFFFLDWARYGANAPETVASIEKVNKLHAAAWAKVPGAGHFAWEAQMAIICLSYFEVFVRKTVGASVKPVPKQILEAWPIWSALVTTHIKTEKGAVLPNFGVNYPRTWQEIEDFFWWWENYPFEQHSTDVQRERGRLTSLEFQKQFCELFFPTGFGWLGGQVFKTFVPPKCRRRNGLGDPNPIMAGIIKFGVWAQLTVQDRFLADPVSAPLAPLYDDMLERKHFRDIDAEIRASRRKMSRNLLAVAGLVLAFVLYAFLKPFLLIQRPS